MYGIENLADFGYWGMLLSSFLAATILPISSEVVLGLLLVNKLNPTALVLIATFGNVAGSCLNYAMGYGGTALGKKMMKRPQKDHAAAIGSLRRYGVWSLLLAWVPVIGDPLTIAAGALKINWRPFLVLVTAGKLARYVVLTYLLLW
jgi:membrane protein YqaA with SNARE-associated domain